MPTDRASLKSIAALCGEGNAPDLSDIIYVMPDADIITPFPAFDVDTLNISAPISAVGKTWESWKISKVDNGLDLGTKGDGDNHHFDPKIEGFIPKLTASKSSILKKYRGCLLAVICQDNNGNQRLMRRAQLTFDESTKSKNGYKIVLACGLIPDPLPYYSAAIPLTA